MHCGTLSANYSFKAAKIPICLICWNAETAKEASVCTAAETTAETTAKTSAEVTAEMTAEAAGQTTGETSTESMAKMTAVKTFWRNNSKDSC